jgi:threonine synthase
VTLACVSCGKTFATGFHPFCDTCGAMVDVAYDLDRVQFADSPNPYRRFRDLLPVEDADHMPADATYTPCVRAEKLGTALGLAHLYLKNETVLATGTTKDRMAAVALPFLRERGVRTFSTSSTGNSSTAYAREIARYPDLRLLLFTGEAFCDRVQLGPGSNVLHLGLRGANFVDAFDCALRFAQRAGVTAERGFFNPGRREGLKIAFLEAVEQVPRPIDWYVQAVSSAMGVYGISKGARELYQLGRISRLPRLLCVQEETCSPMVNAFGEGSPVIRAHHIVRDPTGIANAIQRGDPTKAYPYVQRLVRESGGDFVAVSAAEIRTAHTLLEALEGISVCFAAAAALAGVIRMSRADGFARDDSILVNLTGKERGPVTDTGQTIWLKRVNGDWIPEDGRDTRARHWWPAFIEADA